MQTPLILIVEDDQNICAVLSVHLEDAGFSVVCANSDQAAYAALRENSSIALLIADVDLGSGTTGFDVARFARQVNSKLPVMYLSGAASDRSFAAFGVPGSEFFQKPYDPARLVDAVKAKLKLR